MPEWTQRELQSYIGKLNDRIASATTQLHRIRQRRALAQRQMIPYSAVDLESDLAAVLRALQGEHAPSLSDAPVTSEDY